MTAWIKMNKLRNLKKKERKKERKKEKMKEVRADESSTDESRIKKEKWKNKIAGINYPT